jgi:hypothetical protein
MRKLILLPLFIIACASPTAFTGGPTVPNGRQGCEQRCANYGMQLVGMVTMGEGYTDGCICAVPETPGVASAAIAAAPAVAGVIVQRQRAEAARQQQQQQQY